MSLVAVKHLKQIDALNDPTRFKFWLAGRRGGKTQGIREDILKRVPSMPAKSGLLYLGPTNQDAKDLIWEELRDRIDHLGWRYQERISRQRFEFSRGRYIHILGAEKIRRVRGKRYVHAYLDEVAYYTVPLHQVWRALRPCLSDFAGGATLATTPDGKGTDAYDFHISILNKPDWKYFHWKTIDNPYIDPAEIEAARRELDPKSFHQEYEAGWESFAGLAYYCFDENTHISRDDTCKAFDWNLPLNFSLDFNVNPTSLLLSQVHGPVERWKREYSLKNSSTIETVRAFCEDFKADRERINIVIHGDASGNSRKSNTGLSDYHYLREMLNEYGYRFTSAVPGANPAIIDRVAHTNAVLKNVKGESRTLIDSSCVDLIRDLSSQELDGRLPSPKNNLGHKADAFGYRAHWRVVAENRKPQATVDL